MSTETISDSELRRILENSDEEEAISGHVNEEFIDSLRVSENAQTDSDSEILSPIFSSRPTCTMPTREFSPTDDNWSIEVRELHRELFTGQDIPTKQSILFDENTSIFTIFRSIIDDSVLNLMVHQTNLYAQRLKAETCFSNSRILRWNDVDESTMLRFIGVLLVTGIKRYPTIESYWKTNALYYYPLLHNINMSYNRFNLVLRCWHFVNNLSPGVIDDRLYKIRPLLKLILQNVQKIYTPGDTVVVDESMVPFRGRLFFRQYIPSKSHKYGIKIYKLCTVDGYTWGYQIYSGISHQIYGLDTSGSIVVQLTAELLNEGRLIVTDNYYTSIPLAKYLKLRNTDLLGTVNKKRKGLPVDVVHARLKPGEMSVRQKGNKTVLKWHDKRDVIMLSTCHGKNVAMSSGRNPKIKPSMILDYNVSKKGIDVADQLASYNSPIRKTVVWYKKIALDLLSIAIVNSTVIYNELHPTEKCTILKAYEQIIEKCLQINGNTLSTQISYYLHSQSSLSTFRFPSRHFLAGLPKIPGKRILEDQKGNSKFS